MMKLLFPLAAALTLVAVGCASETGPDQEDGYATRTVTAEEAAEINGSDWAGLVCRRRPCVENADGSWTFSMYWCEADREDAENNPPPTNY